MLFISERGHNTTMTKTYTLPAELNVQQRNDIGRLLHVNDVKTVQEALELISDRWDIKGHQEYASELAGRLGNRFQQEPLSILEDVQAAVGSVTYDELENDIENYLEWLELSMGDVSADGRLSELENYFQQNNLIKSGEPFSVWASVFKELQPFALKGDFESWSSAYKRALDQLTTEDLVFAGEYHFYFAAFQFDTYGIRSGEDGYNWLEHKDNIWASACDVLATYKHIGDMLYETTEPYFREHLIAAKEHREPLKKEDFKFFEEIRSWAKKQLEKGRLPFQIVRGLRKEADSNERIIRGDSQLATVLVDELGLEGHTSEIFSNTSAIGFGTQTPEIDMVLEYTAYLVDITDPDDGAKAKAWMHLPKGSIDISYAINRTLLSRHVMQAVCCAVKMSGQKWRYDTRREMIEVDGELIDPDNLKTITERFSQQLQLNFPRNTSDLLTNYVKKHHSYDSALEIIKSHVEDDAVMPVPPETIAALLNCTHEFAAEILGVTVMTAIERVRNPGCVNIYVPIFVGQQGIGKTTWWNIFGRLGVPSGYCYQVTAGKGVNFMDKHLPIEHQGVVIVNFDEFDAFKSQEQLNDFKRHVTEDKDEIRVLYTQSKKVLQRSCIYVGCSNHHDFATDNTGTSRYLPLMSDQPADTRFDFDALEAAMPGFTKWGWQQLEEDPDARFLTKEQADAISLHTSNFSAQSAYQTDADIYLEDKEAVSWDEITEKLHLRGQIKSEEKEDVERGLVNAGFEQLNKPQWIPINGHPKGGISKRRIWKRKGLSTRPDVSNISTWLERRWRGDNGPQNSGDY